VADDEYPADVFGRLGILHGKSKAGEPVTYNLYGEVKDNQVVFGDLDRFLRLPPFPATQTLGYSF
jgi:phosphatidylinositol transfer protein SFH5